MGKSEFHLLIKHYVLYGKSLSETKAKLDKYYLGSVPSYGMVQKWFSEFRCGHTSTEIIRSASHPNEITTPEMINKIHHIVLNDPKVKVREIAEIVSISTERVVYIWRKRFSMRKLCTIWVLRLLTIDQKRIRVTTSEQNLAYFNRNPKDFLRRFVVMDETWIHYYTPESREELNSGLNPVKVHQSVRK